MRCGLGYDEYWTLTPGEASFVVAALGGRRLDLIESVILGYAKGRAIAYGVDPETVMPWRRGHGRGGFVPDPSYTMAEVARWKVRFAQQKAVSDGR